MENLTGDKIHAEYLFIFYSCDENRCNTQHVEAYDFKLEEEYDPKEAFEVRDPTDCYDSSDPDPDNTGLCITCTQCEYFVDSRDVEFGDINCANQPKDAATGLFWKVNIFV